MSLPINIDVLLRRCQVAQSRSERVLAELARQDDALCMEQQGVAAQRESLRQLIHSQQPVAVVFKAKELFAWQRQLAVIRGQLQDLALQMVQLQVQRDELAQQREQQQRVKHLWQRKENKYQRWATRLLKQTRLRAVRQEENEVEERIRCTR
jgi:hypothetical protein